MSTHEPTPQEGTDTELTAFDDRPTACACWGQEDLACFACHLEGFDEPNPNPPN